MNLSELEKAVLAWFAAGAEDAGLKEQCEQAVLVKREFTGVGVFASLSAPASCASAMVGCAPNAPLISSSLFPHGAGVNLWFANGRIKELEFVTFGGTPWPESSFPYQLVVSL